jgi:hypothetical protein
MLERGVNMTNEELERANYLKKKIQELESFIWNAERVWTGKIIKQTEKYIFKANGYAAFNDAEYTLNTKMKDRLLDVLKEHLEEMKTELTNL